MARASRKGNQNFAYIDSGESEEYNESINTRESINPLVKISNKPNEGASMPNGPLLVLFRAILLLISFTGLCAGIRVGFRVHRMIAPFVAVSAIIVLLMFGGMLGALKLAFYLVYFAGFGGLIYAYLLRRAKPEWGLILALLIFAACQVWRFYPCHLYLNDDVSHWGLVARHLIRYDAFPDATAAYVRFQSYPLGAACFIYYFAKAVADAEGVYLVAMNFLLGPLFLPMLAHIHENRRVGNSLAAALLLVLLHYFRPMNIQVDSVLALFGIGLAATIAYERKSWRRALLTALPGMIAVVYIKNSGMFFALTPLCMLLYCERREGTPRKQRLCSALAALSGVALAYGLWTMAVRVRFPAALNTKHAVSLSAYAARLAQKDLGVVLAMTKAVIYKMLHPQIMQICALAFMAVALGIIQLICRNVPGQRDRLGPQMRMWACNVGVYLLWVLMIWTMYIVSMPNSEAMEAASFARYNRTGLAYMMGLEAIPLLDFITREEVRAYRPLKAVPLISSAVMAVIAVMYTFPAERMPGEYVFRAAGYIPLRAGLRSAQAEYGLPEGGRYLFYSTQDSPKKEYYYIKYEFATADISAIDGDGPFNVVGWGFNDRRDDIQDFLRENVDSCDAVFILGNSEEFDRQLAAFRSGYTGNTPIISIQE